MTCKLLCIKNWLIVWLPLKAQTEGFYLKTEVLGYGNN